MRFDRLLCEIDGISKRTLTVALRQPELDGLVECEVLPGMCPPRVEYQLPRLGCLLLGTSRSLDG